MEIELKNGQKIILEVSPLLLEYIEDYEGGIEQLEKDARGDKDRAGYTKTMRVTNCILYAVVASNIDEPLTYRQAVRLVKLEDIEKIVSFVVANIPEMKEKVQITHKM